MKKTPITSGLAPNGNCGINLTPAMYDKLLEECKYLSMINELKRSNNFEALSKLPYKKLQVIAPMCALLDYKGIVALNARALSEQGNTEKEAITSINKEDIPLVEEIINQSTEQPETTVQEAKDETPAVESPEKSEQNQSDNEKASGE